MKERLQTLPPEQRERMLERLRARGIDPTSAGEKGQVPNRPIPCQGSGFFPTKCRRSSQATTIDALFGPLPASDSQGRVWAISSRTNSKPVRVRLGITDGQATELIEGDLQDGAEVVTNATVGTQSTRPAPAGGIPTFLGGRPPGGNRGGGRGF
jgi:hypothetical protein